MLRSMASSPVLAAVLAATLAAGAVAFMAAPAPAQPQPQQPAPVERPQPASPALPDGYGQKKCPATVDCMPTWDKERIERCKWVKQHCPDTQILQ